METKFSAFVNKNKPAKTTVKASVVMNIARAMGMIVKKSGDESTIKNGESSFSFNGDVVLYWVYSVTEKMLVFQPRLQYTTARNDYREIENAILDELQIAALQVKLPEKVVQIGVPDWADILSDDNWGTLTSIQMFTSEAKKMLREFFDKEVKKLG